MRSGHREVPPHGHSCRFRCCSSPRGPWRGLGRVRDRAEGLGLTVPTRRALGSVDCDLGTGIQDRAEPTAGRARCPEHRGRWPTCMRVGVPGSRQPHPPAAPQWPLWICGVGSARPAFPTLAPSANAHSERRSYVVSNTRGESSSAPERSASRPRGCGSNPAWQLRGVPAGLLEWLRESSTAACGNLTCHSAQILEFLCG